MRRLVMRAVAAVSLTLMLIPAQRSGLLAAVEEDSVEFQDGAGNVVQSFAPGQTAALYVKDAGLTTLGTCTATWTALPAKVPAGALLSLATGQPHPEVYSLSEGCGYDQASPANTPFRLQPAQTATVDGVPTLVTCCLNSADEIALFTDADATNTVQFTFEFDRRDSYAAASHRVRVFSDSDPGGEWLAIAEVAGEADASASPTSALYLGQVTLNSNAASTQAEDGAVWVQPGDTVSVVYYEADGATEISSATATVKAAPVPGLGGLALAALAGLFVAALTWRLVTRPSRARD
ncbi:MAG: hypothetical protein IH956_06250 [Chloroflexi bacterium]|nr:hypothetical protein [Chloroflexota bacterium]